MSTLSCTIENFMTLSYIKSVVCLKKSQITVNLLKKSFMFPLKTILVPTGNHTECITVWLQDSLNAFSLSNSHLLLTNNVYEDCLKPITYPAFLSYRVSKFLYHSEVRNRRMIANVLIFMSSNRRIRLVCKIWPRWTHLFRIENLNWCLNSLNSTRYGAFKFSLSFTSKNK